MTIEHFMQSLLALPLGLDMRQKQQRNGEAEGDVKAACPWP